MRPVHGLLTLLVVAFVGTGCTAASPTTSPATTVAAANATIDLDGDTDANLDLGSADVLVGGGGGGMPGDVSSSPSLGTDFTLHLRCDGPTGATVTIDDEPLDIDEPFVCDGRQHDVDVVLDYDASTVQVLPATDGEGATTPWVLAVTEPQ